MRQLILLSFLLLSGGCFTPLVVENFEKVNKEKSFLIFEEESIEAGVSQEGEIVFRKLSQSNKGGSILLYEVTVKEVGDSFQMVATTEGDSALKRIPIFIESQVDERGGEYIKVLDSASGLTQIEYNIKGLGAEKIDVETYYSKDPYYLKRAGLALALPVVAGVDTSLFGVATISAGMGGGASFYRYFYDW